MGHVPLGFSLVMCFSSVVFAINLICWEKLLVFSNLDLVRPIVTIVTNNALSLDKAEFREIHAELLEEV